MDEELKALLADLRTKTESGLNADSAEIKTITASIEKIEEKGQASFLSQQSLEKKNDELTQSIANLEDLFARKSAEIKGDKRDLPEFKAMQNYLQHDVKGLGAEEVKTLRIDTATEGGVLVGEDMEMSIIKNITEVSPVRQLARVRTTSSSSVKFPVRTNLMTASWEGELEAGEESNSKYGMEEITPKRLTAIVPISREFLQDSAFDMEAEIMSDYQEARALKEGQGYVNGTGVKQPKGFMAETGINTRTAAATSAGIADALLLVTGDIKAGYNPVFTLTRRTLAFIRTLKDTQGRYLYTPALNGGVSPQIAGYNYVLMNDMADMVDSAGTIVSGAEAVMFGDFRQGYTIVDKTGIEVIRDEYTQKAKNVIEFAFHSRTDGLVVKKECFSKIKIA